MQLPTCLEYISIMIYDLGIVVAAEDRHGDLFYDMQVEAFERCAAMWPADLSIKLEIVRNSVQPNDDYCKAIAVNEGIRRLLSTCRIIAETDIDVMIPPIALRNAIAWHGSHPDQLMMQLSKELYHWDKSIEWDDAGDWLNEEYKEYPPRFNCLGSWMSMSAECWQLCGGFNEEYAGWGSDDHDLRERAHLHGIQSDTVDSSIMHLAHPPRKYNTDHNRARNHQIRNDPAQQRRNFMGQSRAPDFVIAGAQKCGTTAVALGLSKSSEIYLPNLAPYPFEIHHFDKDLTYARGDDYYFSWFPQQLPAADGRPTIYGEKTPNYMADVPTIERMHRSIPDAKIVMILRDPIDRAFSALNHVHSQKAKWEGLKIMFSNRVDNEMHRQLVEFWDGNPLMTFGEYIGPVSRALELYGDQLMVVRFSHLEADPRSTINSVARHVGAQPIDPEAIATKKINANRYPRPMRLDDRERLAEHYAPQNELLFDLLGWDSF